MTESNHGSCRPSPCSPWDCLCPGRNQAWLGRIAQLTPPGCTTGPLKYTDLLPYDQHHYHGTEAVDDVAVKVGWQDTSLLA